MRTIETTRFGNVEIGPEHIIEFKDGVIGFPKLKEYVLVESTSMPLVIWLQSTSRPEIAFPLMEPWFFKRDYSAAMTGADRHCLDLADEDRRLTYVIMTIPEDMEKMTVNLKAPIMINVTKALGAQVIQQDKKLEVRVPAHQNFSKALSNLSICQTSVDIAQHSEEKDEVWLPVNYRVQVRNSNEANL